MSTGSLFQAFLNRHDDAAWAAVLDKLSPAIHEVDRNATRIWFHFFPLALWRALEEAEDREALARELQLLGRFSLRDQIDASHRFLYGHRYWPEAKAAVEEMAGAQSAPASLDLADIIRETAGRVARQAGADPSLVAGIVAVAMMTLQQVGLEAMRAAPGKVHIDARLARKTPAEIVAERARDDAQGLFGFLRGAEKIWTVTFDENRADGKFKLINSQHLTTAAANDKRPFHMEDSRCMAGEGPIPVQCRSAACGTCWVGVLGGAEKLSPVGALEYRRIKEFGYIDTEEPRPLIRLACMAQAYGAVSIVIPPWNGVFGRYLRRRQEQAEAPAAR